MGSTSSSSPSSSAASVMSKNLSDRHILLATAQRVIKKKGTYGPYAVGSRLRKQLINVGILRGIYIHVTATVNNTASSGSGDTVIPTTKAPYNLLSNVSVIDYSGTRRINASGYQIWCIESIKQMKPQGIFVPGTQSYQSPGLPAYATPKVPTPAAGASATLDFLLYIPVAYERNSNLAGALPMQSVNGQAFLELEFNSGAFGVDTDAVYTTSAGGSGTITDINVSIYQDVLSPTQFSGNAPIVPMLDVSTIYELNGTLSTTSNLNAGQEKLIDYPNDRTIYSTTIEFVNGGLMQSGNLSQIRQIVNANSYPIEMSEAIYSEMIRMGVGFDLPAGTYYLSDRHLPVDTVVYGNYQWGLTPIAISNGNTKMNVLFESMYQVGAGPLAGLSQG